MPNTRERETVRALVSAFNVNNYDFNAVKTNFKLQSRDKKDYIVVSFDKGMGKYQHSRYLDSIKRKIVGEFYSIEEGDTDEVVLNTANLIFNIESFPFNTSKGEWSQDEQGRVEFLALIDDGVIFNLKSHLASSLVKDVLEDMPTCSIVTNSFKKEKYLCHSKFPNKKLRKEFEHEFLSRMKARYENVPKDPLKVEGNSVYIKDVFDDVRFIDSITRRAAWRIGIDLGIGNDVDHSVMLLKDSIINSVYQSTKTIVVGFMCASPLNRKEASILIPIMQNCRGARFLTNEEAGNINHKFNNAVLDDISGRTQAKLSVNGSSGIYGIDFSNPYISHCVITKIIKNSVINKDHELSIDPELRFRALSRSPSTELSDMKLESSTCSQGVASKDSPRQGSEKEEGEEGPRLLNYVNSVRTSDRPLTDLSYATTSCGVPGISRDLSAGGGTLTEANIPDQKRSSLTPFPTAWNDSTFLNLEGSNEEPEKQQVTDKSDRKSSDEYSEAKPQSESPSSRKGSESNSFSGSSTLSKKSIMPELEKLFILELEKWFLYFQQNGKKLDSTRSTHELSSKKTATSSERKVKSNSPSKVTPVTEVHTENKPTELNDSITELPSQGTVGKLNMPGDRSSKISVDSGLGSLERGQSPSLIEEFSDSLQQTPLIVDKLENIFSKLLSVVHNLLKNPASPTHKDVSGGLKLQQHLDSDQREKLYKALSSKMKKKLDSELFLPEYEKLLYLLYVDKREVRLLLSPPGEVEQVCSVFPSEEKEQAQSSSSEEVVRLFQEFFSNQKVSDNYLTSSKIDSPEIETCLKKEISQAVCT